MKKGIINYLKLTVIFTVFGISTVNAQQNVPENVIALKNYFQTNISPNLKSARETFSQNLTPEEQKEINTVREELKATRKQKENLGLNKPYRELLKEDLNDDQIAFLNASRQQKISMYLKLKDISTNHKQSLEQIFKDKKEVEKWKNDMVEIMKNGHNNRFFALNPIVKKNLQSMIPWDDVRDVMFILWNPDEPIFNI